MDITNNHFITTLKEGTTSPRHLEALPMDSSLAPSIWACS